MKLNKWVALGIVCLFAVPIIAGTLASITLPDGLDVDGQKLVLNGMALRKKVVFKVYVAGLYLPAKEKNSEKILAANGTRCTVMHFMRSADAGAISEAWFEGLQANAQPFPGAEKAVRYPGDADGGCQGRRQARFHLSAREGPRSKSQGQGQGLLPGKAFANALFACWIGKKPGPGRGFQKGLAGELTI